MRDTTIVILTRDRWPRARETLGRLRELHPDAPVIVVDNGSRMAPDRLEGAQLIRCGSDAGAAARNLGARRARTPYVAFCDDDSWWAGGALEAAAGRLAAQPRLAGVVGRVLVEPSGRLDPVSAQHERSGAVVGFQSMALVVRRWAFLSAGGFHARFGIGAEEEEFAMRLLSSGWRLAYEPGAVVHHAPAPADDATRRHRPLTQPRNRLWTAWLRRPLPVAARETARILRDEPSPRALAQAVGGLPWVLRERRVNPPEVERLYETMSD